MKNGDIVQEAYDAARICIKAEFKDSSDVAAILSGPARSVEAVQHLVEEAQRRYSEPLKDKKVAKWLRRASARIVYYGQVLDVLAQHHQEYLALAWGTMKFIFMGILNHNTMIQEFSKALARIGDALPRVAIAADLYQSDTMRRAVSQLYIHIFRFFIQALRWYNKSRVRRAFSSLLNPYELEYKDTVEQICSLTSLIRHVATAESQSEVRDINNDLCLIRNDQIRLIERVDSMITLATNHKTISERIDINVQDMMPMIRDIQFSHILSTLRPTNCPHETLQKLQSIVKRSRTRGMTQVEPKGIIHSLNCWLSKQCSSLFLLRVGPRAQTQSRELTTDLIGTLQNKGSNVIWRIPQLQATSGVGPPSFQEILKQLIHQILVLKPSSLRPQGLDIAKFQATHGVSEWASLFQVLISQLPSCYVVLETHDLLEIHDGNNEADWLPTILKLFRDLTEQANNNGHMLKFLVLCYGSQSEALAEVGDIRGTLRKPAVIPVSRRNVVAHRKGATGWVRVSPKL